MTCDSRQSKSQTMVAELPHLDDVENLSFKPYSLYSHYNAFEHLIKTESQCHSK